MKTEQRSFQIRAAQGEEFVLIGRALSYMEVSSNELAPGVRERIMPGCFRDALASPDLDCKALFNHDANQILGRTKNGTLTLQDRADGLYMRVQLNRASQAHRDIYEAVKRGDLDEMSFAFGADDEDYEDGEYNGVRCQVRNIRKAKLFDVSVVTSPFYGKGATAVSARAAGAPALVGKEFDKYARAKAERIRYEIFQSAPAFKVVNKRTGKLSNFEHDQDAIVVPDYSKCPAEMTHAQLLALSEAINVQIRLDAQKLAEEERRAEEVAAHVRRGNAIIF